MVCVCACVYWFGWLMPSPYGVSMCVCVILKNSILFAFTIHLDVCKLGNIIEYLEKHIDNIHGMT